MLSRTWQMPFPIHPWPLDASSICLHVGGTPVGLSTASQGYSPASTYVTGWMVAQGWPPSSLPTSVKWVHYTNDMMPTRKDRSLFRDALQTSLGHL